MISTTVTSGGNLGATVCFTHQSWPGFSVLIITDRLITLWLRQLADRLVDFQWAINIKGPDWK